MPVSRVPSASGTSTSCDSGGSASRRASRPATSSSTSPTDVAAGRRRRAARAAGRRGAARARCTRPGPGPPAARAAPARRPPTARGCPARPAARRPAPPRSRVSATCSRCRRNPRAGWLEQPTQVGEVDVRRPARDGSGPAKNGGGSVRGPAAAARTGVPERVEAERPLVLSAWREVARVERLQRVVGGDDVAHPRAVGTRRRPVERVEQLAERHGRRHGRAGALVGAGVGDDEVVLGGADGVEEQLAVLAARVALADPRVAGEHVVAVAGALPREDAVVQAEQADDAVRHRAHRHEGADGQRAGAEAGPGRPAGEAARRAGRARRRGRAARCCRRRPRRCRRARRAAAAAARPCRTSSAASPLTASSRPGHPLLRRCAGRHQRPARRPAGRPARRAGRPGRCRSCRRRRAARRRRQLSSAPSIATPSSSRSSPSRQVPCSTSPSCQVARCSRSSPHRTPARDGPVAQPLELVVVEPEPLPHRGRAGEVEHLRWR